MSSFFSCFACGGDNSTTTVPILLTKTTPVPVASSKVMPKPDVSSRYLSFSVANSIWRNNSRTTSPVLPPILPLWLRTRSRCRTRTNNPTSGRRSSRSGWRTCPNGSLYSTQQGDVVLVHQAELVEICHGVLGGEVVVRIVHFLSQKYINQGIERHQQF